MRDSFRTGMRIVCTTFPFYAPEPGQRLPFWGRNLRSWLAVAWIAQKCAGVEADERFTGVVPRKAGTSMGFLLTRRAESRRAKEKHKA